MPGNILLTGFSPFGGETINPSWQAVRTMEGETVAGHRIVTLELPCEFEAAPRVLRAALRRHRPDVVIATGQAGGRVGVSLERVAINLIDARIPDNAGLQPVDEAVLQRGPAAYFSRLPIKSALLALQAESIPAHISQTAGTFVCNQVFYVLMHALRNHRSVRAGFVHVPWLPEQCSRPDQPRMQVEDIRRALRSITTTTLTTQYDVKLAAGVEC